MANILRRLVSQSNRRYQGDGYDLDLCYVTDRIIAMGKPSQGREGYYRNPVASVLKFLEQHHGGHYRVYNLCAESCYDVGLFGGSVVHFPFEDHQVPPLMLMLAFCEDAEEYLLQSKHNVIVVHCKAGKGRTGVMVSAFLVWQGTCPDAQTAMQLYAEQRSTKGKGVTIPSQRRYVGYFKTVLQTRVLPCAQPLRLLWIEVRGMGETEIDALTIAIAARPTGQSEHKPFASFGPFSGKLSVSKWADNVVVSMPGKVERTAGSVLVDLRDMQALDDWQLEGDIKVQVSRGETKRSPLFHTWFHTAFLQDNSFMAARDELDKVKKSVPGGVSLQLKMEVGPATPGGPNRSGGQQSPRAHAWACSKTRIYVPPAYRQAYDSLRDLGAPAFRKQLSSFDEDERLDEERNNGLGGVLLRTFSSNSDKSSDKGSSKKKRQPSNLRATSRHCDDAPMY